MDYAYAAADVVISRSGAMSIAELCIVQKPVVFVPYPYAAEDHQKANAMNLVNKNAALMIEDKEAMEKLVPAIVDLVNNESRQVEMKNNMGKEAIANADTIVANEIINALS
jgi:UDP-N-acetylglucosamine--N-acetylmuramyl-(pentapeptide) pyrophosphoryl-undecaprenol N-acetylglucosamine transferase